MRQLALLLIIILTLNTVIFADDTGPIPGSQDYDYKNYWNNSFYQEGPDVRYMVGLASYTIWLANNGNYIDGEPGQTKEWNEPYKDLNFPGRVVKSAEVVGGYKYSGDAKKYWDATRAGTDNYSIVKNYTSRDYSGSTGSVTGIGTDTVTVMANFKAVLTAVKAPQRYPHPTLNDRWGYKYLAPILIKVVLEPQRKVTVYHVQVNNTTEMAIISTIKGPDRHDVVGDIFTTSYDSTNGYVYTSKYKVNDKGRASESNFISGDTVNIDFTDPSIESNQTIWFFYYKTPPPKVVLKSTSDASSLVWTNETKYYGEIKEGSYNDDRKISENWEAMAGVPNTESLYINVGGTIAKVIVYFRYVKYFNSREYGGTDTTKSIPKPIANSSPPAFTKPDPPVPSFSEGYKDMNSVLERSVIEDVQVFPVEKVVVSQNNLLENGTIEIPASNPITFSYSIDRGYFKAGSGSTELDYTSLSGKFTAHTTGKDRPADYKYAYNKALADDDTYAEVLGDTLTVTINGKTYKDVDEVKKKGGFLRNGPFLSSTCNYDLGEIETKGYTGEHASPNRNKNGDKLAYAENIEMKLGSVNRAYYFDDSTTYVPIGPFKEKIKYSKTPTSFESINPVIVHNPVSAEKSKIVDVDDLIDQRTEPLMEFPRTYLDYLMEVNFPNKGDFNGNPNLRALLEPTAELGPGYTNDLDTTEWTKNKYIRFDTIAVRLGDKLYPAKEWIKLDKNMEDYYFYIDPNSKESRNAKCHFIAEATNTPYSIVPMTVPADKVEEDLNKTQHLPNFDAYHYADSEKSHYVIGRLGNVLIDGTNDPRYSKSGLLAGSIKTSMYEEDTSLYDPNMNVKWWDRWSTMDKHGTFSKTPFVDIKLGYEFQFSAQTIGQYNLLAIKPWYQAASAAGMPVTQQAISLYIADAGKYKKYWGSTMESNKISLDTQYPWNLIPWFYDTTPTIDTTGDLPTYPYKINLSHTLNQYSEKDMLGDGEIYAEPLDSKRTGIGTPSLMAIPEKLATYNCDSITTGRIDSTKESYIVTTAGISMNAQRWHAKLSLPSSTVVRLDTNKSIINKGYLLVYGDFIAKGDVWNLRIKSYIPMDKPSNWDDDPKPSPPPPPLPRLVKMPLDTSSADDLTEIGTH